MALLSELYGSNMESASAQIWSGAIAPLSGPGSAVAAPAAPAAPVDLVSSLLYDNATRDLATLNGLSISSVAWEDTGRTKGSCFGPNISDMTLCVAGRNMPIIRKPNFSDLTSDQAIASFTVNVGNESGQALRAIPLSEYLRDVSKYTDAKVKGSLLADRDTHVLTSAQACVLPLKDGKVEFGVKLYNYQSHTEPAVLVIVASAQGTSTHFVLGRDNVLNFNKSGKLADFVAERLKDDRVRRGVATEGAMTEEEKQRNAILIYQVPLVYHAPPPRAQVYSYNISYGNCFESCSFGSSAECTLVDKSATLRAAASAPRGARTQRGMDHAVVSTTEGRGTFPALARFEIERDTRMPIRCTIQYYHVTDTATIATADMETIAAEVVRHNPIGSLVVDGKTARPTEHKVPAILAPVAKLFGLL